MAGNKCIDKQDVDKHESEESAGSSPLAEEALSGTEPRDVQDSQPQKRKGGRKPIYATSEERKQRNRQAQAAFRERRTEYIKQLEEAIEAHEQNLASLQAAHRHAADECLMLRYKNSLLERILLEKGIDVQAELHAKTGSPTLGHTHVPQMVRPPPIQRAILSRHARKSVPGLAPKLESGLRATRLCQPLQTRLSTSSAANRHALSTRVECSTATSPFGSQHGGPPAGSDPIGTIRPHVSPTSAVTSPQRQLGSVSGIASTHQVHESHAQAGVAQARGGLGGHFSMCYSYQGSMEGQEPEYDAAADLADEAQDVSDIANRPKPYPPGGGYDNKASAASFPSPRTPVNDGRQGGGQHAMEGAALSHAVCPSMTQLLAPDFDYDPFGLSESMAFPDQFTFDVSDM